MNKNQLKQFLRENEIWTKKSMGQNFLVDGRALQKIITAADIKSSDTIIEIGPGLGVLTEELSKKAGKVIAIEKDDKFAEALRIQSKDTNVEILHQDALEFNPMSIGKYKVVANIPYNITSLVIRQFLEAANKPELMVLLVQKEVAQRIVAKQGDMSLLSVSVQFYAEPEIVATVPASAFFPQPKVESAIIKLRIKNSGLRINERDLFRIVRFGFAAKRKTLENNLAAGLHITKAVAADIIRKAGLEEKIRAQDLEVEDWLTLYRIVSGAK